MPSIDMKKDIPAFIKQSRQTVIFTACRLCVCVRLIQLKEGVFIVLYIVPDVCPALLDNGMPLGFQLFFLRFDPAAGHVSEL